MGKTKSTKSHDKSASKATVATFQELQSHDKSANKATVTTFQELQVYNSWNKIVSYIRRRKCARKRRLAKPG